MAKFKVYASYIVYLELELEAENLEAAYQAAYQADGADFKRVDESDFKIDEVKNEN
jgi:hypothetical protein